MTDISKIKILLHAAWHFFINELIEEQLLQGYILIY